MIKKLVRRLVLVGVVCLGVAATLVATPAVATAQCTFVTNSMGAGCWPGGSLPTANLVDDREISNPTGWWTYLNVDAAQVSSLLNANDARPTDLRVLSTSPLRFSVTMVRNSGASYSSAWWWYYGVSKAQVNTFAAQNNARLTSAVRYGNVYAVVMVPNYGANYKAWDWCDTDFAGVGTCLGSTYRLTNIEAYGANKFVVIVVKNVEGYGWCWFAGVSRAALNNVCSGQSVLDVSQNPDGTFNVASVAQSTPDGRVKDFATPTDLVNYAVNAPADRPLFVTPYVTGGTTRWLTSFRYN
ncbi:hypothetical protein [Longispora urticae]